MMGPARFPSPSGALDRLPVRWQQRTRALRRRAGPVADVVARRTRAVLDHTPWSPTPLVSIVLPVYDVAEYLPDCLASLAAQTHPRLEIIAVDDGSPDDSIDILRAFAATDPRLRVVQQANAGLGAARNVGAARARGAYLMFLDSDDVLLPRAVQRYVEVLERTGSDFAVSLYQRLDASGPRLAAPWTRAAHRSTREQVTLAQFPEVMVNAVAWSKCYRRSFWASAGLRFPEGVLYEDQAVSARAYARAARFDVLADLTHQWRVRDDGRSITQQSTDVVDLRARFRAAEDSLAELRATGAESAAEVRRMQLLSNDFPLSIRASQHADDDFWTVLRGGLQRLHQGVGPDQWARVPAQHRIAALLVERDLRAETTEFMGLGHANPKNSPALLHDGQVFVQVGVRNALGLAPDDPALALAETQIQVVAVLHRVSWRTGGRLELQGWAYLDNVDLGAAGVHLQTRIEVVDLDDPDRPAVPLLVRPVTDPEVSAVSKHAYADYTASTFVTEVDATQLDGRRFGFRIELSAGGITRTGSFGQLIRSGSGGALRGRVVAADRQATPTFTAADGLVLTLARPMYRLAQARTESGGTRVDLDTDTTPAVRLELEAAGAATVRVALEPAATPGPARSEKRVSGLLPALAAGSWTLRAIDPRGRRLPVGVPDQPAELALTRLRTTAAGNLAPLDVAGEVVVVDSVQVDGPAGAPALRLSGASTLAAGTPLRLELRTASGGSSVVVAVETNGRVAASIPLTADRWGFGGRVLPSATYDLVAAFDGRAETAGRFEDGIQVRVGDALLADLPR
ncbi:MAG: glycosyltransferase family 2 protein, partial [Propionibacteriaceae bacterium]